MLRHEEEYEFEQNPYVENRDAQRIAAEYCASKNFPPPQPTPYVQLNEDRSRKMAAFFEEAKDGKYDTETQLAYMALVDEVEEQFAYLPVKIIPVNGENYPYKDSKQMMDDVLNNGQLAVFDGGDDHSLLTREQNFKFRAVHDFFGHCQHGFAFGPRGEENAWIEHSKMFSPPARQALTCETRMQNSWVNFGPFSHLPVTDRPYAQQKAFIPAPEFCTHPELEKAYADYQYFYSGGMAAVVETVSEQIQRNSALLFETTKVVKTAKKIKPKLNDKDIAFSEETMMRVEEYFFAGQDGMNWYEVTPRRILEIFNHDEERTRLFIGFLAATSPLRNIRNNTRLALEALMQFDNGARFYPTRGATIQRAAWAEENGFSVGRLRTGKGVQYLICPMLPPTRPEYEKYVLPTYKRAEVISKYTQQYNAAMRQWEKEMQVYEMLTGAGQFELGNRNRRKGPSCEVGTQCCFLGEMPNHEMNCARVALGVPLSGPKVTAFYKNLTMNPDADEGVTVDTWMLRAFGLRPMSSIDDYTDNIKEATGNAPSRFEYEAIELATQQIAMKFGVKPRQAQAAIWVGVKAIHGDPKDISDPFEVELFRQMEQAARQQVFDFADELSEVSGMRDDFPDASDLVGGFEDEPGAHDE